MAPGAPLKVRAHGFCGGRQVRIGLEPAAAAKRRPRQGRPPRGVKLSTARLDRKGHVFTSVHIPRDVGRGAYALVVNGRGGNCSSIKAVRSAIKVADAPANKPAVGAGRSPHGEAGERLPFTGLGLMLLTGAGLALLVGGLLLRRRVARPPG